jgi:hypothetical protein
VPLNVVTWNWSGDAVLSGTNWTLTNTNHSVNPTGVDTTTYPWYTNNLANLTNFIHE